MEKEIKPFADEWIAKGAYPLDLHIKAYKAGIGGIGYPKEIGGTRPDDYDSFYELIQIDEMSRVGGGSIMGQSAINSMAIPPIINYGSDFLKELCCRPVIKGEKHCSLAISEPYAGSDVANIKTTAELKGDHYVVNGIKKWITGGAYADFFTTLVRTGGDGFSGLSLLLIPKELPGIKIRKMQTQFDTAHNTTFITLEDVKVPTKYLIGEEGMGALYILTNFNHERFIIAVGACRSARLCYEEAVKWALERETFGKKLISHQIIRAKLAEMVRQIEALHDNCERVAYQFSKGVPDAQLGSQCALLKVQASKTFEFCAREASQIFGGSSIVKEGRGKLVERLYREVRASAIPGGSEEILLDFTMRQVASKAAKLKEESKSKL